MRPSRPHLSYKHLGVSHGFGLCPGKPGPSNKPIGLTSETGPRPKRADECTCMSFGISWIRCSNPTTRLGWLVSPWLHPHLTSFFPFRPGAGWDGRRRTRERSFSPVWINSIWLLLALALPFRSLSCPFVLQILDAVVWTGRLINTSLIPAG